MDDIDRINDELEQLEKLKAAARGYIAEKETAEFCIYCGLSISQKRRVALPGCETCIDCAEMVEFSERKYRDN